MFLKIDRLRRGLADDSGAALLAAVGVMLVGLVLATVIASTTISALSETTASRASVQSQGAADAGIAAARAGLQAGTCSSQPTPGVYLGDLGSAGTFRAEIFTEGATTPGCPALTARVRILSTGTAANAGVGADKSGNSTKVEAVLAALSGGSSTTAPGPAIYAYGNSDFRGSGKLISVNGSKPYVVLKTGDARCGGAATSDASIVIDAGSLKLDGSCNYTGSAFVSGAFEMEGSTTVSGDVVAASAVVKSSTIGGSLWTTGASRLTWGTTVTSAYATPLTIAGGNVKVNAWSSGAVIGDGGGLNIDGKITAKSLSGDSINARGGTNIVASGPGAGLAAPAKPAVPKWIDFAYKQSDWPGFQVELLTGNCRYADILAVMAKFGTNKGIVDARSCTTVEIGGADKVALKNDVVFLAKKFDFDGSSGFTATKPVKLYLITPDEVADSKPTPPNGASGGCTNGAKFELNGAFTADVNNIAIMMYSPCTIELQSSLNLRGQIYGGGAEIQGGATFGFVPIGLPNWDMSTGNVPTPAVERLRTVESIRNVGPGVS